MPTARTYQEHLIAWARRDACSKTQDWPGFPLTQLPFSAMPDVGALADAGLVRIVERVSPRTGLTHLYVEATS